MKSHRPIVEGGLFLLAFILFQALLWGGELLHGDEIGFQKSVESLGFQNTVSDYFDHFRYYRILGAILHFGIYSLTNGSLLHLSILLAVFTIVSCWLFFDGCLKLIGEGDSAVVPGLIVILFCVPFSFEVTCIWTTFHQICSVFLIALCLHCFHVLRDGKWSRMVCFLIPVFYLTSLFTYEIVLFAPFFIGIGYVVGENRSVPRRFLVCLVAAAIFCAAVFLLTQFYYKSQQPKLSEPSERITLHRENLPWVNQGLRKVLCAVFYVGWSIQYCIGNMKILSPQVFIGILFLLLSLLRYYWSCFVDSGILGETRSGFRCAILGMSVIASFLGLWGYYWITYGVLITPPLYATILPSMGFVLVLLGIIRSFNGFFLFPKIRGFCLGFLLIGGLCNLSIIVSLRLCASISMAEAQKMATMACGENASLHMALGVLDMTETGRFARYRARFLADVSQCIETDLKRVASDTFLQSFRKKRKLAQFEMASKGNLFGDSLKHPCFLPVPGLLFLETVSIPNSVPRPIVGRLDLPEKRERVFSWLKWVLHCSYDSQREYPLNERFSIGCLGHCVVFSDELQGMVFCNSKEMAF